MEQLLDFNGLLTTLTKASRIILLFITHTYTQRLYISSINEIKNLTWFNSHLKKYEVILYNSQQKNYVKVNRYTNFV